MTAGIVTRAYLVVVLVLAVLVCVPLQIGLALGLLAIQLFLAYKTPKPELKFSLDCGFVDSCAFSVGGFVGVYAVSAYGSSAISFR